MLTRVPIIARTLVLAGAALALLVLGLNQASAFEASITTGNSSAQTAATGEDPIIQASERISIPYGFDSALRLSNDGANVIASGEGSCTAGETITIAFTVTQAASGATASDVWSGDCAGELQIQTWTKATTVTAGPNFTIGPAEASAYAETRDAGNNVTDTQAWTDPVVLTSPRAYLPLIIKPSG